MKNVQFIIILSLTAFLILATASSALGYERNALIHYSESEIGIGEDFLLEQEYSFKVIDIGTSGPSAMVEIYHQNDRLKLDDHIAGKNSALEYVVTDSSNDKDTEYLVLRLTPMEIIGTGESSSIKIAVEQYRDPRMDTEDFLLFDRSRTVEIGSSTKLENDYVLHAYDYVKNSNDHVSLRLEKNGHTLADKDISIGDVFYYNQEFDGKVTSQVIARVADVFSSRDSDLVFLEQISLRDHTADENHVDIGIDIDIVTHENGSIYENELIIVRYHIEGNNLQEASVLLDGNVMDLRRQPDSGSYFAVLENVEAGEYDVKVQVVSSQGSRTSDSMKLTVYSSDKSVYDNNISESDSLDRDYATENLRFWESGNNNSSGSQDPDLSDSPSFVSVLSVVLIAFASIGGFIIFMMQKQ